MQYFYAFIITITLLLIFVLIVMLRQTPNTMTKPTNAKNVEPRPEKVASRSLAIRGVREIEANAWADKIMTPAPEKKPDGPILSKWNVPILDDSVLQAYQDERETYRTYGNDPAYMPEVSEFDRKTFHAIALAQWLDTGNPEAYRAATGREAPKPGTMPRPTDEQFRRAGVSRESKSLPGNSMKKR